MLINQRVFHIQLDNVNCSTVQGQCQAKSIAEWIIPETLPNENIKPNESINPLVMGQKSMPLVPTKIISTDLSVLNALELYKLMDNISMTIKEGSRCAMCKTNRNEVIFLPCKHQITCFLCSYKIKECIYCNTSIENTVSSPN